VRVVLTVLDLVETALALAREILHVCIRKAKVICACVTTHIAMMGAPATVRLRPLEVAICLIAFRHGMQSVTHQGGGMFACVLLGLVQFAEDVSPFPRHLQAHC